MNIPRYNYCECTSSLISQARKTSWPLHQVNARNNCHEYSSFCKPTTQNKLAFTTKKKHVRNNDYEYSSF